MGTPFDPNKDTTNRRLHDGISLSFGDTVLADPNLIETADTRIDYGEDRFIALGRVDLQIYVVVYADYGHSQRLISVRKANGKETERYYSFNS